MLVDIKSENRQWIKQHALTGGHSLKQGPKGGSLMPEGLRAVNDGVLTEEQREVGFGVF